MALLLANFIDLFFCIITTCCRCSVLGATCINIGLMYHVLCMFCDCSLWATWM